MDHRQAVITALYNELTTDPALQGLCGGTVRLVDGMPPPNTKFPYLTHRIGLKVKDASWAFAEGDWYLDIWDHSPNADAALAIRACVIALMDQLILQPAGGEVVVMEIRFVRDGKGPTDAPDIYRLMTQWELHLDRQVEVVAVLGR